jgi:hypothetical protein
MTAMVTCAGKQKISGTDEYVHYRELSRLFRELSRLFGELSRNWRELSSRNSFLFYKP